MPRWTISASGPSSFTTRYLPRRCTDTTLRPTSGPVKSALFLWRRTERVPVTSTALIFLPTTSFSRSRRKTSTSGSSGMVAPLADSLFLQARPCAVGRRLFGLLLRSAFALAVKTVVHVDQREELLRVIG